MIFCANHLTGFYMRATLALQTIKVSQHHLKMLGNPASTSQPAITCSKLTIETLEQGVKYVQS